VGDGDRFINSYGSEHKGMVVELDSEFRGYKYFEPYTQNQIESLEWLLLMLTKKWNIPRDYNEDMFKT